MSIPREELEQIFKDADIDQDGFVSLSKVIDVFARYPDFQNGRLLGDQRAMNITSFSQSNLLKTSRFLIKLLWVLVFVGSCFFYQPIAVAQNVFPGSGNVGIGTTAPNHELVIQGDDPAMQIRDAQTNNSENAARLELLERADGNFNGGAFLWWNGESNKLLIGTKNNGTNTNVLVINRAASNVGIGTTNPSPSDRLAVNGRIRAKEIVVETGWSDFVFNHDYKLMSLPEVENYIQKHRHLPGIPSATEVDNNGVQVGQMESRLLQKVEELTLHIIDLHKQIQILKQDSSN
jgi:hypothetical protein